MLSQRFTPKLSAPLLLALAVALPGCFNDTADLKLAKAPKVTETLNDGQKIRVLDTLTANYVDATIEELTASMIDPAVGGKCGSGFPSGPGGPGAFACGLGLNFLISTDLCVARTQLALAKPQAGPIQVGRYSVQGVSGQDRARFALDAILRLEQAIGRRLDPEIRSMLGLPIPFWQTYTPYCKPSDLTSSSYANIVQYAAGIYIDLYHTIQEGFDIATSEMVNVGDSGQTATAIVPGWGSLRDAPDFRSTLPAVRMTREGAARLLAGGINIGTAAPMAKTRCALPELGPDAKAALAVFRAAAPNPSDVITADLNTLLNGTLPSGSVKQRLADAYDFELLSSVEQHYALDTTAFADAREYLRDEIATFQRSSLLVPSASQPGGRVPVYRAFAGTAGAPEPLDAAYYFGIARTPPNLLFHQSAYDLNLDPPPFSATGEFMPLTDWIDAAIGNAADYIKHADVIPENQRSQAMAALSVLTASGERQGLVQVRKTQGFFIYGYTGTLLLVRGEDNLRCAVRGSSEGGECPATIPGYTPTNYAGRKVGVPNAGARVVMNPVPDDRWYLVRAVRDTAAPGPGDYEVLAGFDLHWVNDRSTEHQIGAYDSYDYGAITDPTYDGFNSPVIPAVQRRVRELLAPSQKSCAHSKFSCVLTDVDARLPLENELSDDGNGVESSWKHYLDLAEDAAALADNLGTDYINSGLENSQRQEEVELRAEEYQERARGSLNELQNICGADIDLAPLLDILKNQFTCNGSGACDFDIQAIAADPANANNPAIQRIARCVTASPTDTVPLVSLGTKPLCLWTHGPGNYCDSSPLACSATASCPTGYTCLVSGSSGKCVLPCVPGSSCGQAMECVETPGSPQGGTCQAAPGSCPAYKPENMTCEQLYSGMLPPGATVLPPTTPLGYFETPQDALPGWVAREDDGTSITRCDAIAMARDTSGGALKYASLIAADSFLDSRSLAVLARRVNWEARYGGFSAILVDSIPQWDTGSAFGSDPSAKTTWPCGLDPSAHAGSFFKRTWNCGDSDMRAQANDTLLKAVLGAQALSLQRLFTLKYAPNDGSAKSDSTWHNPPVLDPTTSDTFRFWSQSKPVVKYSVPAPSWTCGGPIDVYEASCSSAPNPCVAWTRPDGTALETSDHVLFTSQCLYNSDEDSGLAVYRATRSILNPALAVFQFPFGGSRDEPVTRFISVNDSVREATGQHYGGNPGNTLLTEGGTPIEVGVQDALNGLELMCRISAATPQIDLSVPPSIVTVADLPRASAYLQRLAERIRTRTGLFVLTDMPSRAVDALRNSSATGAYPAYGGQVAESISSIRQGLISLREYGVQTANEVQQLSYGLSNVYDYLKQNVNQNSLSTIKFAATQTEQIASCASQATSLIGLSTIANPGSIGSVAINCANSLAQINFAAGIRRLEQENTALQSEIAIGNFATDFSTHASNLQAYSLKLSQGYDELEKGLAALEQSAVNARRALSAALYLNGYEARSQAGLTIAVGNLYQGKQVRYQRALENAKRLAVLARTAIEQRLGATLDSMKDPLPLVDAPSKWQADVCTFSGTDYQKLLSADSETAKASYADGFVGDYVTKLRNVVESYRLAHSFHEGTDTSVLSLKNDVMSIRVPCDVPGPNLLYHASSLPTAGPPGWQRTGCTQGTNSEGLPLPCITLQSLPAPISRSYPDAHGYAVTFGPAAQGASTGLVQRPTLKPGKYRFSWYANSGDGGVGAAAGKVVGSGLTQTPMPLVIEDSGSAWARKFIDFTVPTEQQVAVGFYGGSPVAWVGAPMLELLPSTESVSLTPFADTTGSLDVKSPVCEDVSGDVFRGKPWVHDCILLCPDGYSSSCANAQSFCYHEAKFDINQRDLQLGRVGMRSSFARGNFNYRIESVALNFVGTALRDCASQPVATPCYSAGYVPYSLYHNGPFYIRNDVGADFKVDIFDGKIESARGLALERYLTNPLSETDRSLLQDYVRTELQGRPLDGNFVIRVWDQDGVDFDAIQDVQILLKYRYWTRFN